MFKNMIQLHVWYEFSVAYLDDLKAYADGFHDSIVWHLKHYKVSFLAELIDAYSKFCLF